MDMPFDQKMDFCWPITILGLFQNLAILGNISKFFWLYIYIIFNSSQSGLPQKIRQNSVFPAICLKYSFIYIILGDLYTFSLRHLYVRIQEMIDFAKK